MSHTQHLDGLHVKCMRYCIGRLSLLFRSTRRGSGLYRQNWLSPLLSIYISDQCLLRRKTAADGKGTENEKNDDRDEHHHETAEPNTTGLATEGTRAPVRSLTRTAQRTSVTLSSNRGVI